MGDNGFVKFRCKYCAARYKVKEASAGKKGKCKKCGKGIEVPFPPLDLPDEVTSGGSVIHRHEPRMRDFEIATGCEENIELISDHIEKYIGKIDNVFHELMSDLVHIDVHIVKPTEERPFYTLVTSGMSDRKMNVPTGAEDCSFAELVIALPEDWSLTEEALEDYNNYWPIGWLKQLARFPHEYETWLFHGHTVPNGDPPKALADNTDYRGWLVFAPLLASEEFLELRVDSSKTINFLSIIPLYEGEMNLKLAKGVDELVDRFEKEEVCELVQIGRKDVSKKRFWPFG